MLRLAPAIVLVLTLAGCGTIIPEVDDALLAAARVRRPDAAGPSLQRELMIGRELFTTRCNACHGLPGPIDHDPLTWDRYLAIMAPRAHLAETERTQVLTYLLAAHDVVAARP